ncbi:AAA-like domain-containing protein [Tumidithrix elongata RA019]|uniref:non-specific serine/threonine protein kinase n=1 Tax=Tumidithrix elongata BACA0141 TaxID=2716417 RepID=A0AAW9Q094_9CYAN|nr:AAA-like domain-containing protein [Tumidithrix elongata RA019]
MTSDVEILAGRYQIVNPLGAGGFGQTFLARDNQLPDSPFCVVKQLKPQFANARDLEVAKRLFDREAKTLHHLGSHDQIPQLMAHFEQNGEFYLVLEFIEGQSLELEIGLGRQWRQSEVLSLLRDLLKVLASVHNAQVIHRDIKPANLIRRDRDRKIILIDFGAVKTVGALALQLNSSNPNSKDTLVLGSPGYMPSEQLAGRPQFSSDIYAVGILCLQALTGVGIHDIPRDEHTGEFQWQTLAPRTSPRLADLLDTMVRYDYRQRFENAMVALKALAAIVKSSATATVLSTALTPPKLEEPSGQVATDSVFYMERPPIEHDCFEAIAKPGSLIRIKAPRQMGKSSLLGKILHHAALQGGKPVSINLQNADSTVLTDLDRFLRWFCANVGRQLKLKSKVGEFWDEIYGSKDNCTEYFEQYLLAEITSPLILALDEVDLIFQYRAIAEDFFGLLRAWHEQAKNSETWKRVRLIVAHSQEVYIPLNINQSPFNVGLPIELREFTLAQVRDLIHRHQLKFSEDEIAQLMSMVGGHPYLVRIALYDVARHHTPLTRLLQMAPTEAGLYSDHLRRHLWNLEQNPKLSTAMQKVVGSNTPVRLPSEETFKLDSMGLILRQGNDVIPRCNLYRIYFRDRFEINSG